MMLDVETLLRPLPHGPRQFAPSPLRVVRGEAGDRHDVGAQVHGRVEVASLPGLLEQDLPATDQLGHFAPLYEGPQREGVHGVELPGDAGATASEYLFGPVA